jgi:hypothetical protein
VVEEERKVGDKKAVRERIQNKVRLTFFFGSDNIFFQIFNGFGDIYAT